MVSVFLSHSSKDKPFVRELAEFLRRDGDIRVWFDEDEIAPGENIVSRIGDGLDADVVLLILSPDSVESNWVREEWTDAFWEQTNNAKIKLAGVLYRDCKIPRLLANKEYFDLRTNQPKGFREIRSFLREQAPRKERVNSLPMRPPMFIGREKELAELRQRLREPGALVPICEMGGQGKTTLALEFAHRYQQDFEAVYWLPCQSSNLASIAAELARQLGLSLKGELPEVVRELKTVCGAKRCLLILDNVDDESPGESVPGGEASVLVTTRSQALRFLRFRAHLDLPVFTEEQCFELFRKQLGAESVARHEAECRKLFQRLGRLPIAVSVSAALIRYDVRYTISSLAAKPPADVTALLQEAVDALPAGSRQLLGAMAACAPEGFALDLATEIAGLEEPLELLQQLAERSLIEELDRDDRRYRLHALVREVGDGTEFGLRHAQAVERRFRDWESNWRRREQDLPDFKSALDWVLRNRKGLGAGFPVQEFSYHGYELTRRVGRLTEAFEISERMRRVCEAENDNARLRAWLGNHALILRVWGRLKEAMALHKKEESICLELGNREGLQITYGNQALILQDWGQLEEAMALNKQREAICLELGNKDSLQITYGNQALILQDWGRLDEAMALHKKQEEICLELGNKNDLQGCYGNQGLILKDWGRLDEAMALHKRRESICLELGNKDSLQRTYGNQAAILTDWGRLDEAMALLKKREAICLELGDNDSLQTTYGNQAVILTDWARLDEAMALLKKQEAICLELGNKAGLGYCYWSWGLLEHKSGKGEAEREKLSAALALFTELGMPIQRDAVQEELEKARGAANS